MTTVKPLNVLRVCRLQFLAVVLMCMGIVPIAQAQKFVKHKVKYQKFVWYEIKYPDGNIGLSVDNKKNIIAGDERNYTSVEYLSRHNVFKVKKGIYTGIIDKSGNEIITPDKFCKINVLEEHHYQNNYNCYQVGIGKSEYDVNLVGIVNMKGDVILPCIYKRIELKDEHYTLGILDYKYIYWFYTERRDSITGDVYEGVCDTTGVHLFSSADYDFIIPEFESKPKVYNLPDNIIGYIVTKNSKWGICDKNGYEILAPAYEHANLTDEQGRLLINFEQNGKEGIADTHGNILIFPRYDNVYVRNSSGHLYFHVKDNNREGICDANGTEIIPPVIDGSIIWHDGYETKKGDNWVTINLQDFTNPAQKISSRGNQWVLSNTEGTFSIRAYDILEWDEESRKYIGSLQGYTTLIDQLGKEENSISKQIFNEAYKLPDNNIYDKIALYNMLIEVDANNKEGYQSLALNNIGVLYHNNGDEDTALKFYDKASTMGNPTAKENAEKIRKARKAAARAERLQRISDALGQINNALSSFSTTAQYNGLNQTTSTSSTVGNANARQSAYNHMANRAASLYHKLKNGYVGSSRTHSVDVSTYNSLRRKMRNYRTKAKRDGISLQKSQYEDLSL